MAVFVLDKRGKPLMPCTEKRARLLLARGRARVHRVLPMVVRLVDREAGDCQQQPLRIKLDPGSKTTGMALVRTHETIDPATGEVQRTEFVLNLFELVHRGKQISEALSARRAMRRRRRNQLRFRAPRFLNRTKPEGWLAPSLQHRVVTTMAWVGRFIRFAPVTGLVQELVRFDMQKMENPEISGVEYQQGTLAGYEVREYLLEKWGRQCAYCDTKDAPLQVEHIRPKAQGGSNRISNLALSCADCNQRKNTTLIEVFLANRPERLKRILAQAQRPLRDAAAVNSTRWALRHSLAATGLALECASGGRTKYNRTRFGLAKTHALDAACVGSVDSVRCWHKPTLTIKATGRGSYQRTRLDKYGFPRGYLTRQKRIKGFQTGDMVKAIVPTGKKIGAYAGRVAVRASGSFNIQTSHGLVDGVSHRYCEMVQRADGYGYVNQDSLQKGEREQGRATHAALSLPGMNAGVSRAVG